MSTTHRIPLGVAFTIGLAAIVFLDACHDSTTPSPVISIQLAPTSSGDLQRDTVLATPSPLRVIVRADDAPALGVHVYWTIELDGAVISTEITTTDPMGIASVSLTFGSKPAVYVVKARVSPGQSGSAVTFTLTATPGRPAAIWVVSGPDQTDTVTALLAGEYVVQVTDAHGNSPSGAGNAVPDVIVDWSVTAGGGTITPTQSRTTAPNGYATARLTLGRATGVNSVIATVAERGTQVAFNATATVARPTTLVMLSGNNQSAETNHRLGADYVVRVTDSYGNPAAGVVIDWTIVAGGGEVTPAHDTTDVDGVASTRATGGTSAGAQIVKATASVLSALTQLTFTATITAPLPPEPEPTPPTPPEPPPPPPPPAPIPTDALHLWTPVYQFEYWSDALGIGQTQTAAIMAGNNSPLKSPVSVTFSHGGPSHTSVPVTVVIPAGSSSSIFSIAAVSPGSDVLIATAPGYASVSRTITVSKGLIYSFDPINYYGPWEVAVGDSTPISFFLTAPNFDSGVSLIAATTFTIEQSGSIQFRTDGPTGKATTSFTIPAGGSATQLWIKGIAAGNGNFTVTHPDYQPFSANIVVKQ